KNSGGKATKGKIAAARALGIKVVMLRRPALPDVPAVDTVQNAVAWLDHAPAPSADRGVETSGVSPGRSITPVNDEPTMMSVAMSAADGSTASSGPTAIFSSGRPIARPKITGVDAGRCCRNSSNALPSCQGRAREIGL